MEVIGIKRCDFRANDGNQISGYQIFAIKPIEKNGDGYEAEKLFLSDQKVLGGSVVPAVGKEIEVTYNKYGKVDKIVEVGG